MVTNQQQSDEVLARLAATGDRAAFNELVQRYCRPLAEFAAARLTTFQDAEDIVQETFLRAYTAMGSFDPSYSLKNWLFTIAYRLVVSEYRKKRPDRLSEQAAEALTEETESASPQSSWLWNEVRKMKTSDHDILWLRYKQDMEIEDIAAVMGKSASGIRVQLHRARKRLAKKMKGADNHTAAFQNGTVCLERTHS